MGMLYVLDEPSIGLHPKDNVKMIATLESLRDIGNTVIVVEHDEDTIRAADHLVEMGPGAGVHGGHVVVQGTLDDLLACKTSPTGQFLSGKRSIATPGVRRKGNGKKLTVRGARENNLQSIDVTFPLGALVAITGASGSGKSTLLRVLSTLLRPDRGRLSLLGHDPGQATDEVRARTALLGHRTFFYEPLTALENLALWTRLLGREMSPEALLGRLEEVGLRERAHDPVLAFSAGMRQRLALARILLKKAPLLILDEATSALDNISERHVQRSLGITAADSGTVTWQGRPVDHDATRRFGYMPEERGLYPKMRIRDQLVYLARLHGLDRTDAGRETDALLERLDLADTKVSDAGLLELAGLKHLKRIRIDGTKITDEGRKALRKVGSKAIFGF